MYPENGDRFVAIDFTVCITLDRAGTTQWVVRIVFVEMSAGSGELDYALSSFVRCPDHRFHR